MKSITVPRIERLRPITEHSSSIEEACLFVLNHLAATSTGAVFAKCDGEGGSVKWMLSHRNDFVFSSPTDAKEILAVPNVGVFCSMLARLGENLMGEIYLGAGFFVLSVEGGHSKRCGIFFSNNKETGCWIKLQRC